MFAFVRSTGLSPDLPLHPPDWGLPGTHLLSSWTPLESAGCNVQGKELRSREVKSGDQDPLGPSLHFKQKHPRFSYLQLDWSEKTAQICTGKPCDLLKRDQNQQLMEAVTTTEYLSLGGGLKLPWANTLTKIPKAVQLPKKFS